VGGACLHHGGKTISYTVGGTSEPIGVCVPCADRVDESGPETIQNPVVEGTSVLDEGGKDDEEAADGGARPIHGSMEIEDESAPKTTTYSIGGTSKPDECTEHAGEGASLKAHPKEGGEANAKASTKPDSEGGGKDALALKKRKRNKFNQKEGREGATTKKRIRRMPDCSHEGCENRAVNGGVCQRHGAKVKRCKVEGCTNQVVKAGVCKRHGAVKQCNVEGCTDLSVKGGVCMTHRANVEQCKRLGCTRRASSGGVCTKHRSKPKTSMGSQEGGTKQPTDGGVDKICSHEGCSNKVFHAGLCRRHKGYTKKTCKVEGCTLQVINGGVCQRHGARRPNRKRCSHEGCTKVAQKRGLCRGHGGFDVCSREGCRHSAERAGLCISHYNQGSTVFCTVVGCTNKGIDGGVCRKHGAKVVRYCSEEGCTNHAVVGGVCKRHGGKVKIKICNHEGCTKLAQRRGLCIGHGGFRICSSEGCTNRARDGGLCVTHTNEYKLQTS